MIQKRDFQEGNKKLLAVVMYIWTPRGRIPRKEKSIASN
jgi:hypothetical protein